ncbi:MAG: hypothetical protein HRT86_10980 [Ilumatobacteraceae bacterium]|nr:hypothetical protein [Ilumatobacteraceae bacterium]
MPITWRNVDAPTATGASRILDSAGRSFDKGIGSLSNLANQITNIRTSNQRNDNRINTENALSGIAGLDTFAGLDQARQSGQFENLPQGTDLKAVRQALANRGNVIDDTLNKEFQFDQRVTKRDEFGRRQELEGLIAQGDFAGAEAVNATLGNQATGANAIAGAQRSNLLQQRADTKYREDRQFQQGTEQRQANALQAQFDNDKALIDHQNRLINAPKETTGAKGSTQTLGHLDRLETAVPNETVFGNILPFGDAGSDSGGAPGRALVAKGIRALEKEFGRQVPAEFTGIAVDNVLGSLTGEDDTIGATDNSYSPDDVIAEIRSYMEQNTKADASIRNRASELEKNRQQLNTNLDRINKNRATRFPSL